MAYTYMDFLKAADKSGTMGDFAPEELQRAQQHPEYGLSMVAVKRDYKNADTEQQKLLLNETANQLKETYSTPAAPGATAPAAPATGGFQYGRENEYRDLLNQTLSQGQFNWDLDKDPRWASYRKSYGREGERAQENAMARAMAMTGGRPSSYAATAAAQTGNYFAGKLTDIIPQLYGQARQEYNQDIAQKYQQLDALRKDRGDQYNIYLDSLNEAYRQDQAAQAEAQRKFQNALAFQKQFGYLTPEMSEALGLPPVNPNAAAAPAPGGLNWGPAPRKPEDTPTTGFNSKDYVGQMNGGKGSLDGRTMREILNGINQSNSPKQLAGVIDSANAAVGKMTPGQQQLINNAINNKLGR